MTLASIALAHPAFLSAAVEAPPKRHAERLTYDPKTGWTESPDPVPGTEDGDLDIARQWLAREEYDESLDIVEGWIKTYGPDSDRYPEALYLEGTANLGDGDYRDAHDAYQALLNDYPGSEYAEPALSAEFRIAEQYLAGQRRKAWGGLLRIKDREKGIEIMDDIIVNYPDTALAEYAQLAKAEYYYVRGEHELAEDEYATFAREYPRSRYHSRALYQSAQSALASFPGVKFDDAGLVEAQERFDQFRQAYPALAQQLNVDADLDDIASKRADKTLDIGKFYQKTDQPGAARYYYRAVVVNWPDTAAAAEAQSLLAKLGEGSTSADGGEAELAAHGDSGGGGR